VIRLPVQVGSIWIAKINIMTAYNFNKSRKEVSNNLGKYNLLIAVAIIFLGACYMIIANQSASVGAKMNDLQKESDRLQMENQSLAKSVSSLQSIARLESESERLQLVASGSRQYLNTSASTVAMR